ncbi:MAG: hypothetical protein NZL98_02005, partial [Anaerolineales bacterium]|nr:hypothetical protein [Anaerolineales bacterium]
DMLLEGQLKTKWKAGVDVSRVWLAVEISGVVDAGDVQRAWERAELLRWAGFLALPVAAGRRWTEGAQREAVEKGVVLQMDGQVEFVEEALAIVKGAAKAE